MKVQSRWKYSKLIWLIAIGTVSGLAWYHWHNSAAFDSGVKISKFNKERAADRAFIFKAFDDDHYWLTNNPDFSVEYMLEHMAPRPDPKLMGKEQIFMLEVEGQPVGFGSVYMQNFYEGWIHFLYLAKEFRGRGYALQLMQYMIDQLWAQGAKIIKLWTRVNNLPGRRLYEQKLGFQSGVPGVDGFILYELRR